MISDKNIEVEKPSNSKIIRTAILTIVAFSFLTIILVLNMRGRVVRELDINVKHRLNVIRVLDLEYPRFSEKDFILLLSRLEKKIKNELGYNVEFRFSKTVLADNWLSADLDIFSTQAAKDWFKNQRSLTNNFNWLRSDFMSSAKVKMLSSYYSAKGELLQSVKNDFNMKAQMLLKSVHFLKDGRVKVSGAYWNYFMENFVNADFIVSNSPIFLPYKDIPIDAVTRGGLIINLSTKSKNKVGRAYLLSLYQIIAKLGNHDIGLNMANKVALQGFASYLIGIPLSADSNSSMYPLMGDDFKKWERREHRTYKADLARFKKSVLKRK